jgi:hypothetical protein
MIDAAERHESILDEVLPIFQRILLDHKRRNLAKPSILVFVDRGRPEVHIVEESGLRSVLRTIIPLQGRGPLRYGAGEDLLTCVVDAELITEFRIPIPQVLSGLSTRSLGSS